MISFGVPAGATTLCQMPRSKPGNVSPTVGISGASESRLPPVRPRILILPVAPQRQRDVGAFHAELNIAGQNSGDLRRAALVGHLDQVDAGHHVEQRGGDLRRRRADADVQLAGLRLRKIDHVLHVLDRDVVVGFEHRRDVRHLRDRLEILERVVGQLGIEERVHHQRAVDGEQDACSRRAWPWPRPARR